MKASQHLEQECRGLKNAKATLEARVRELRSIKSNIDHTLTGDASKAMKSAKSSSDKFRSGLDGVGSKESVCWQIEELGEGYIYSDSSISNVVNNIDDEIKRCSNKIDNLNIEINRKNQEIRSAKEEERKERLERLLGGAG